MTPTFADLGVPRRIVRALDERGITRPFDIQAKTIADTLAGRDLCGRAPTGSGKTLAFGIPLVATVDRAEPGRPRALVLAPTRELAEQISSELGSIAGPVRIGVVYGGVGYGPQLRVLRRGVDILVACPGRLEDLIDQGQVDLSCVDRVVLDEADRMADMGFLPAVRRLLDRTDPNRQTVLFSATLDGDVAELTRSYQRDPVRHEVGDETPDITGAQHRFWKVTSHDRTSVTAEAIDAVWPAIVFCRTRHGSDRLARRLGQAGIGAATIHGGRSQNQRTRALERFAQGRVQALIATDVAARGIHVDGVASVIHFDPPEDHKAYLHRSGRTARAGEGGVVLSLVQPQQMKELRRLQRRVDLDEPVTDPDPGELRAVSPDAGTRTTRPRPPGDEGRTDRGSRPPRSGDRPTPAKRRSRRPSRSGGSNRPGGRPSGAQRSRGSSSARKKGGPSGARKKGGPSGAQRSGGPSGARKSGGRSGERRTGGPSGARKRGGPSGAQRHRGSSGHSGSRPRR